MAHLPRRFFVLAALIVAAALHVWSTAADNLNGTAAGNFVVRGWS